MTWVGSWGRLEVEHNGKRWLFFSFLLGNKLKETGEEGERRYVKELTLTPHIFVFFFLWEKGGGDTQGS